MKIEFLPLGAGLLVGIVYSLLGARSPAPPAIALIGLLGILLGEQIVLFGRQVLSDTSSTAVCTKLAAVLSSPASCPADRLERPLRFPPRRHGHDRVGPHPTSAEGAPADGDEPARNCDVPFRAKGVCL